MIPKQFQGGDPRMRGFVRRELAGEPFDPGLRERECLEDRNGLASGQQPAAALEPEAAARAADAKRDRSLWSLDAALENVRRASMHTRCPNVVHVRLSPQANRTRPPQALPLSAFYRPPAENALRSEKERCGRIGLGDLRDRPGKVLEPVTERLDGARVPTELVTTARDPNQLLRLAGGDEQSLGVRVGDHLV
jgi:hypothetical protein